VWRGDLKDFSQRADTVVSRQVLPISSTLKMDATRSSETSVYNKPTRRHIPETAFFIVTAVKTSNPTDKSCLVLGLPTRELDRTAVLILGGNTDYILLLC
jgi:hypothetical protein